MDIPIEKLVEDVYESASPTAKSAMLSQLVGKIYESAPATQRVDVITQLMKPLGILSLVAVANGVFAKIRFRAGGWSDVQARVDDVQNVQVSDVVALASYTQQVSLDAIDGLVQLLTASPVLASTVAAALLIKIWMKRGNKRSPGG